MILVPKDKVLEYTKNIKWHKGIKPIKINDPCEFYILPDALLNDEDVINVFNNIGLLNKSNFTDINNVNNGFVLNKSNYYLFNTVNFEDDLLSGYVEIGFWYDGFLESNILKLFTSSDETTSTRYFQLQLSTGKPQIAIRNADTPFTNNIVSDNVISEGYHIIKFISDGSSYEILVDNIPIPITVVSGANDGKWIGHVNNVRDNIGIGVLKSAAGYSYSREYICSYVDFNNKYKWVSNVN